MKLKMCVALLVVLLAVATRSEGVITTEATPAQEDPQDIFDIVRVPDASLAPVGPGKSGRVGLWAHGISFEDDAVFFEEEDKAYAEWFEKHQIEQQRKKMEELRARRAAKRSESTTTKSDINTAAAIKLRSSNRRRVLNSKTNLLHMKFKALQVDVRGALKRFHRALGAANRTLSEAEAHYAALAEEYMAASLHNHTDEYINLWGSTTVATESAAAKKKKVLSKGNSTNSTSGNSTSVAAPWISMGRTVGGKLSNLAENLLINLNIRGSLPYPTLLEHDDMAVFELERSDLIEDARELDAQLARAEAGLHDTEAKLRTSRLEKLETEEVDDEEDDDDISTEEKKPKASKTSKKETSSQAEARVETKRRQKERIGKYKEMRALMETDVFHKIQFMQRTVDQHRKHYIGLIRSAASLVPDELVLLRKQKSENQRIMTRNDESTAQLRQEMKTMTKRQKALQSSIAELEAIDKASNAITRSNGYPPPHSGRLFSSTSALTFDVAVNALRLNLRLRRGEAQQAEQETRSASLLTQIFGLTNSELQDYLVIPLLAAIIIAWTLQTGCTYVAKGTVLCVRRLDVVVQRLRNHLAPKSPTEVARFNWKLFALTSLQTCLRLIVVVVLYLGRSIVPLVVPFICVAFFEGRAVRRDEFFGVTSAYSLFYRTSHLIAVHQRVAVYLAITLTSGVVYLAAERVGASSGFGGGKAPRGGARRLGRN